MCLKFPSDLVSLSTDGS